MSARREVFLRGFGFLFYLLTPCFTQSLIELSNIDRSKQICTAALLLKYFRSGEKLSGSVLSFSITTATIDIQDGILQVIHSDPTLPWTVAVKNTRFVTLPQTMTLHEKPQCYFFVVENLEDDDIEDIFQEWRRNVNWNPLAQFVVFLASVEQTDDEMTELMIEILLNFMNKKMYNVNVIGQHEESRYFYGKTVFPYHPDNNCGNRVIAVETLDACEYIEKEPTENDDDSEGEDEDDNDENDGETLDENDSDSVNVNGNKPNDMNNDIGVENDETKNSTQNSEETPKEHQAGETDIDEIVTKENTTNIENQGQAENDTFQENSIVEAVVEDRPLSSNYLLPQNHFEGKRATLKFEELTLANEESGEWDESDNNTVYPRLYMAEFYRALFHDKFPSDLSGCPLVAAYRPWEPYIFVDNDEEEESDTEDYDENVQGNNDTKPNEGEYYDENANNDDSDDLPTQLKFSGIEYKLVQTIAERLHISIDLQVENTNLYNLFQMLIDGEVEMIVGGIDEDPSISQYVSSSIPYYQDDLTWCVAKAKRTYNLFNFLEGFDLLSWTLLFTFIILATFTIIFTRFILDIRASELKGHIRLLLRIFGIILNQSVHTRNAHYTLKIILGTLFFLALLFNNIYQSFLVSSLTTPRVVNQISHVSEIYRNRMEIFGSVENVRNLNKNNKIFDYLREKFQACYDIEECLVNAAKDERIAVAVSRQHYFFNQKIPRDQLYCFGRNENIYVYMVTMLMPKKFHLLHMINPVVQHVIESGHMEKWSRDLDLKRNKYYAEDNTFKSLNLSQIGGSFVLAAVLLAFAFLALVVELLTHWMMKKRRTRLKFFRRLHGILLL